MLHITTSTSDELFSCINIDDFESPWTSKIRVFSCNGFLQSSAAAHTPRVNCDKMAGDRLRQFVNRNCCRLSCISWALAQIVCIHCISASCGPKQWGNSKCNYRKCKNTLAGVENVSTENINTCSVLYLHFPFLHFPVLAYSLPQSDNWWRDVMVMRWVELTKLLSAGFVGTWMDDCLQAGKPSRYRVSQLGRLSLLLSMGW